MATSYFGELRARGGAFEIAVSAVIASEFFDGKRIRASGVVNNDHAPHA
jgi:hypothetical protein